MTDHIPYKCPPDCDEPYCEICDGGLFSCVVCGCAEGELPTECPGERVPPEVCELIFRKGLDYKEGKWWLRKELNDDELIALGSFLSESLLQPSADPSAGAKQA